MTDVTLREVDLAGYNCHTAVTDLLINTRSDDPLAGLWEAGDLQWWWTIDNGLADRRDTFWLGSAEKLMACLLTSVLGSASYCEAIWRPIADDQVRKEVFPKLLSRLVELDQGPDHHVWITVDERDIDFRKRLEVIGFHHVANDDMVQMWQQRESLPDPVSLPTDMYIDDDRSRPPDQLHHLAARNGERIGERLRERSLYRPDLDLCIRTNTGEVAAYCLCWLDQANGVGLFEPVRTENAYQRRGLGRVLLTEGIRRLMERGADLIKVSRDHSSEAARGLYKSVGFQDAHGKLRYVR